MPSIDPSFSLYQRQFLARLLEAIPVDPEPVKAKKRFLVRRFEIVEGVDFGFSGQRGGKYDGISAGNLARAFPDRYSIEEEEC
jgi:hypothetical protein